jgi:uncharacterized protein (DUF39 family)
MAKTIEEINEKIKKGKAVVLTAEEIVDYAAEKGVKRAAQEVDVVTTGTFGPMCSSGAYFNVGHTKPRIKLGGGKTYLNDVPVYTGLAAVDFFLGATAMTEDDPRNKIFPGKFAYGGAYVIEELVAGKDVRLTATAYGTDCYPKKALETYISLKDMNEAVLLNIRNAYQNYNVAVNDPLYKTIGIGTRIFLGGWVGYVVGNGTQHNPGVKRTEAGVPKAPSGTLCVTGDLKMMSPKWLRGTSYTGYGVTLTVGIGVPIPILNEEILRSTAVRDEEILAQVVDYSDSYPQGIPGSIGEVNYKQLKSGRIMVQGKEIPTSGLSSYLKARGIARILKEWIETGKFFLTQPVELLPSVDSGIAIKPLKERPIKKTA